MDQPNIHREPFLIIEPPQRWLELRLGELWKYRDLLITLSWRDIKVRYKQTVLGAVWALIQPFMAMIIFTLVFSKMAKLPTEGKPAPLFYYSGLLAWTFFSQTVTGASQSLLEGSRLITKVYFPRIMIPTSVIGYTTVNFLISSFLLLILMPFYKNIPSFSIFLLPLLAILLVLTSLGVGVFIAALNVKYRDFRYVVPFMLQIWMFATPVVYPVSIIPEKWRTLACLNPMVGIVNSFRACLLGSWPNWKTFGMSAAVGIVMFVLAVIFFRKVEDEMADII